MKLKLQKLGERHPTAPQNQEHVQHSEAVLGVGWLNSDEILSCSDDHQVLKWNIASGKAQPVNIINNKDLSWSADGTQLIAGCATGAVLHAQVIEKRLMWENLEAVQVKRKTVNIRDLTSEVGQERLETRDRVTKLQLGFNYLVVATTKQFYIFSARNWNTPVIVDLKEGAVSLILLCEKSFLMVLDSIGGSGVGGSGATIQTLNYEGRMQATLRLPSSGGEPLGEHTAAISNDVVVIRDRTHHHTIHLFETLTGKTAGDGKIRHTMDVIEVAINQCGPIAERRLAFVDTNGECWLAMVNSYGVAQRAEKIGSLVSDLHFNTITNMLSAFQDQSLVVWTYPSVVFTDKDLLAKTIINVSDSHDSLGSQSATLGKSSIVIGFIGNTVTIRRSDGCLTAFYVPPFIAGLINCVKASKWDQAVRICRTVKEDYLWATLAGMSAADKNYTVAEICYGQLLETEKVLLLGEIRAETDPQLKNAMMALFNGNRREADMALVQNGRLFRAIMANLAMFKFDRALELAIKSQTHLDTVLGYRQRYLEQTGRKESDPKFLKYLSQVEIDWPHIREKIQEDEEKEKLVR
ncbi:intraflagellar transport protein 80 like protein [Ditylenchus destructor]|nr:intraflagellar transport protein 80 like protein [Ditylenchus destructor]